MSLYDKYFNSVIIYFKVSFNGVCQRTSVVFDVDLTLEYHASPFFSDDLLIFGGKGIRLQKVLYLCTQNLKQNDYGKVFRPES